jgi:phytanoyl-CoA hydroxylase
MKPDSSPTPADRPFALSEEQRRSWEEDGFVVLKSFFDAGRVEAVNQLVESLWENPRSRPPAIETDVFVDTPEERRIPFREAPDSARRVPYKLNNLYLQFEEVRRLSLDPRLSGVLDELLGGTPLLFNTLNLEKGSQQRSHFDTFYMPPRVPGKMVATWIALEATHDDNGPLRYFPRSHKIPPYRFSHGKLNAITREMEAFDAYIEPLLRERGISPLRFHAEPGDVFIWNGQLYHGGDPIKDPASTRKSMVSHYFRARDNLLRHGLRYRRSGGGYYLKKAS